MRIFAYEFRKLIGYRVFLFITAACLAMAVFAEINHIRTNDRVPADYGRLAEKVADMSNEEAAEFVEAQLELSFIQQNEYDQNVLFQSREQLTRIGGYEDYLTSINEQCANITKFSLFANKGSFAYKNALKTRDAYNNVKVRTLPFNVSKGVENVLFSSITDVLMLFSLFAAAVFVFTKDKEIGIMNLLFSYPKGRSRLCLSKLSVMLIISLILEIIFTSALIIINAMTYGFGDLSRPIQSVDGFMECAYNLSVMQYMLLSFFIKWLGCGAFAMLFSVICICSKNSVQIYGISLIASAAEILLYTKISRATNLGLLHDLNIISFIKPDNMLATYRNLDLFNEPFNALIVIPIVWLITFSAFSICSMIIFSKGRNREYKRLSILKNSTRSGRVHGRMYYAFRKSLSLHGSFAIICIWLVAVTFYHMSFTKPASVVDFYYKQYTEQCRGNITSSTDELIDSERQYFSARDEEMMKGMLTMAEQNEYNNEQLKRQALEQLAYRADTVKVRDDAEIFYDTGYIRAFGIYDKKETYQLYLLMLTLCALTVSPIIAYDKSRGLTAVIYSTATGKRKYLKRCITISLIYSAMASIGVMIPFFANILRKYGTQGITAPIQSTAELAPSSLPLSIWQYGVCLFMARVVIVSIFTLAMLTVSYNTKSRFTATLIDLTVFVMPLVILIFIS